MTPKQLGTILRAAREAKGLTVRAVAERLEMDWSLYRKFESGERSLGKHARPVARVLGLKADELEAMATPKLPKLAPYLRAKFNLSAEAIAELESHFAAVTAKDKKRARRTT